MSVDAPTYVQRIAGNYLRNMAPLPDAAPPGVAVLHALMASLYRAAAEAPADLGLPLHPDVLPRSGSRYNAASRAVAAIPRLLYRVGRYGDPATRNGVACLRVAWVDLTARERREDTPNAAGLLDDLAPYGVRAAPVGDDAVCVSFPDAPDVAAALADLATAADAFAKDDGEAPMLFSRVDARLLTAPGHKAPPITVDDALRALDDASGDILRTLDGAVTGLGYRPTARCTSLARGAWRASYRHPRLGKTLFGYVVEEGVLTVRLLFDRTERILPFILSSPEAVRASFLDSCACRDCGKCGVGPRSLYLDGALRRLCSYGYHKHPNVAPDEVAALRMLLETQAQFLAADAEYA